ncbi:MAG TPA: alpha/beta fold hydrolase [Stellaceae bacterium]|nr:alpha/beta fold hydrolase [Stellaceae bacterium]
MRKVLFLPGAGGSAEFWKPVGSRLPAGWAKVYLNWPGLGREAHDLGTRGIDDLLRRVEPEIDRPVDLIAQSMGAVIAARLAIAYPTLVQRLVLTVTSAGVDMARFGAADWRPKYRRDFPHAARWITEEHAAAARPVERILTPTLLIWGDADPISRVAVGRHLESRMPNARLIVIPGGGHRLAQDRPDEVAPLVAAHLA